MLVGTDLNAALTTIAAYPIDIFGMNCATGPKEMQEHIQYLKDNCPVKISCLPNAGIPENGRKRGMLIPLLFRQMA